MKQTRNQKRALIAMMARRIGALYIRGAGWTWPQDVRINPYLASAACEAMGLNGNSQIWE